MTTHWPHRRSSDPDAPHNGVWVADEKKAVIAPIEVGTWSRIYETQSGRPILKEKADGKRITVRHHRGKGGIVSLAEVTAGSLRRYGVRTGAVCRWKWHLVALARRD